jgi:hypothetical protein
LLLEWSNFWIFSPSLSITHIISSHNTLVKGVQPFDIIHIDPMSDTKMCLPGLAGHLSKVRMLFASEVVKLLDFLSLTQQKHTSLAVTTPL